MELPKLGDFVISKDAIYEIVKCGNDYYEIEEIENPSNEVFSVEFSDDGTQHKYSHKRIHATTSIGLKRFGQVVRKEEATKAIEILFKNN